MQATPQSPNPNSRPQQAFTLIELLVSMTVLSLMMVMVFSMVTSTQKTWNVARSRVSQFREARAAFEAVTQDLRQATLNTYFDYDYGNGRYRSINTTNPTTPQRYQRQSELHFISGPTKKLIDGANNIDASRLPGHAAFFQIPGGFGVKEENSQFKDLLNARGYFVEYGEDTEFKPDFLRRETKPRYRFRLMELRPPTETLIIYQRNLKAGGTGREEDPKGGIGASKNALRQWFTSQLGDEFIGGSVKRPIADNIIAAFFLPKLPERSTDDLVLAPDYVYDSRLWQHGNPNSEIAKYTKNLVPPLIEVTMVAVDEKSMIRYQQQNPDSKESMPDFVSDTLFTKYNNYRSFQDDLEALKAALDSKKIAHRVFSQTIPLRASGWSQEP